MIIYLFSHAGKRKPKQNCAEKKQLLAKESTMDETKQTTRTTRKCERKSRKTSGTKKKSKKNSQN